MNYVIEKLPKKTLQFKFTLAAEKVSQAHAEVLSRAVKQAKIKGFRPGEAPRSLVEPSLDQTQINDEIINQLVPPAYDQAIKESHVRPLLLPKIEIGPLALGKELTFTATTCEAPEIKLGGYKEKLSALGSQISTAKTLLGPDGQPIQKETSPAGQEEEINKIFEILLETSPVEVSDLLIEDEVSRMLGRLIDQTGRLGLTVEQYLESVGQTVEGLRQEYRARAEKSLKLEFILTAVAKEEGIRLEEKEISDTINSAPDEGSRQNLARPESRAYLESVLTKNKVIQKLLAYSK